MSNDVTVVITRETAAVSQAGFGLLLILATNTDHNYKEYTDLAPLAADFAENTEAYKIANRLFGQTPRPQKIAIYGKEYIQGEDEPTVLTAALNQLVETNNDWYFLLSDQQEDAEIIALSAWIDAQKKLYFASTNNLALVGILESERTVIQYHHEPRTYPAEGWAGRCAPKLPGSITWKFKTINGVSAANIGVTELNQLHTAGGNSYIRKYGILQTTEGKVTSGEYIDVIRGQDFIDARIKERTARLFATLPKVPYGNQGIALIVAEIVAVMKLSTEQGIILTDDDGNGVFEVTSPDRFEISANDIANRFLPDIEFRALLAGAVHTTEIRGVLRY